MAFPARADDKTCSNRGEACNKSPKYVTALRVFIGRAKVTRRLAQNRHSLSAYHWDS